ncbi:hypothetical protein BSKO_00755 [Bryopsis sp. KO-2023]|nr:hypothetical protein BSKO_00755 [Bryopsis sp. KO-2023]
MGKAKPAKHTSKELAAKAQASLANAGGGKAGLIDRKGGALGHSKFSCYICGQAAPSLKNMEDHFGSKHPKENMDAERCENKHAAGGSTTVGVAVRGWECTDFDAYEREMEQDWARIDMH